MPIHRLRESLLPRISLSRPVTVVMIFIALLVVGYIASTRIPLSMLPGGHERRWIGMWITYRNASPAEVEQVIARPVEARLRTLGGVREITTSSSSRGCWAFVRFRQSVDMDEAYNRLRDQVDRIKAELPEDVSTIRIVKRGDEDIPVLRIGFSVREEPDDLYTLVEEQIMQPIERIDGVARVEPSHVNPARAEIEIIQERANAHGVNVYALVQQLRRDNFSMSSGYIRDGSERLFVRSDSRFRSFSEVENLPIEGHPGLTIRDVARVTYEPREPWFIQRVDGDRSFSVAVFKESMANTVEVTEHVVAMLEEEMSRNPHLRDFGMRVLFDQGTSIKRSLSQLMEAGIWGGFFALFILFFFLRRFRMTLVIIGAIPLSVLVSLATMYFMGWSLNIVTMMGLIIGVGMVVDNSIVVVEAIYARRIAGETPYRAALHGASEVGLAITVSTLTTIVVFLPLIFLTGDEGMAFYMSRIGMPVIFALLGSLLVALLFVPLLTSRLLRGDTPSEPKAIDLIGTWYNRTLKWVITHRLESVILTFLIFATITIPWNAVPRSFDGRGRFTPQIHVGFTMPSHYEHEQTDAVMSAYEAFINERREQYGITTIDLGYGRTRGRIRAFLDQDDRAWYTLAYHNFMDAIGRPVYTRMRSQQVLADIRRNAPRFPGVDLSIDRSTSDVHRTSVSLFGDDTRTLIRLAAEVERRLRTIPAVTEVNSDIEDGDEELRISVDRARVQQFGLDGRTVASTLGYALRGMPLRAYHAGTREVDLRVRLREEDRQTLDQVLNMMVVGEDGQSTRIGNVVNVDFGRGLDRIRRQDGRTRVQVTAISTHEDIRDFAEQVRSALAGFEMPHGYQWSLTGQFEQMQEQQRDMTFAIIMSIVFVFLLMGILFESFSLPLSVILAVPFSFLGVYWMLHLTNTPMDMMANIGLIVLIGVVVNNAIVLVDLINRLRHEGYERMEAIVEAGRTRMRPILMTSVTTIFGLIPMALGNGDMAGVSYHSMGRAMIGGLISATFLTLFVVPLFYTLFDDLREVSRRLSLAIRSRPGRLEPSEVRVRAAASREI